jgi:hypothetical protein
MNDDINKQVLEYLKACHVHFAVPCFAGQLSEQVFMSMMKFAILAGKLNLNYSIDTISNESLIPRARNNLVAKMLGNEHATHLMFIDADIGFEADAIIRLLLSNKDVIGGAYPMKKTPISYVINSLPGARSVADLVEVSTLGTGFMMIKRGVLELMIEKHPELKVNDNIGFSPEHEHLMYALFDTLIDHNKNYLSEDYAFCYRWRLLGGECWIDTGIKLNHVGTNIYVGDTDELKRVSTDTMELDLDNLSNINEGC